MVRTIYNSKLLIPPPPTDSRRGESSAKYLPCDTHRQIILKEMEPSLPLHIKTNRKCSIFRYITASSRWLSPTLYLTFLSQQKKYVYEITMLTKLLFLCVPLSNLEWVAWFSRNFLGIFHFQQSVIITWANTWICVVGEKLSPVNVGSLNKWCVTGVIKLIGRYNTLQGPENANIPILTNIELNIMIKIA